jgi:hypothetical protein
MSKAKCSSTLHPATRASSAVIAQGLARLKRFETLLEALPGGYVFDGEIVALEEDGRPRFYDLVFGRRPPCFIPFDLLFSENEDVRPLPLKERKGLLAKAVRRYRLQNSEPALGEGIAAFQRQAACHARQIEVSSPNSPTGASSAACSDPSRNSRPPSIASSRKPTPIPNPSYGRHAQTASSTLSNEGRKS